MYIPHIYTIYTPNAPLNTPYTPHIHPIYTLYTPYIHSPLQANELTLQFAAMRVVTRGPGPTPRSVFFSFQFFNCLPTRTERMMLDNEGDIDEVRRENNEKPPFFPLPGYSPCGV